MHTVPTDRELLKLHYGSELEKIQVDRFRWLYVDEHTLSAEWQVSSEAAPSRRVEVKYLREGSGPRLLWEI